MSPEFRTERVATSTRSAILIMHARIAHARNVLSQCYRDRDEKQAVKLKAAGCRKMMIILL